MITLQEILKNTSNNEWCWKIFCTTCGHSDFYNAFNELEELKPTIKMPRKRSVRYRGLRTGIKLSLAKQAQELKFIDMEKEMKFPDWLGYIGLINYYTEGEYQEFRNLSRHLLEETLKIIPKYSLLYSNIEQKIQNDVSIDLQDLEAIESLKKTRRQYHN